MRYSYGQKEVSMNRTLKVTLFITLLASLTAFGAKKPSSSSVDDDMRMIVKAGIILGSNDAFDEFQTNNSKWSRLPFDAKKGVLITCSRFNKEHSGNGAVVLRDYMSGAKLASYDAWHGIKIAGADD
jgi:hypothetical protein